MLVGIPERHLLTAATLRPDDDGFAAMFAEFIVEQSGGADEPIDRRVFEIVDGRLVEFERMTDGLRVEIDGPVATLTLDRPEALNALTVRGQGRPARGAGADRGRSVPSGPSS